LDPDEFPSLPAFQEKSFSTISAQVIREMIEKTVYAASNEESRYHLNGILLTQQKKGEKEVLRMVSTDGHRLSLVDREEMSIRIGEKGIIIPKKGILEIKKILGEKDGAHEIEIYFDQTHGFFRMGKSLMVVRLIEGDFPDYEQVIPKQNNKMVKMEKEKIYGSLKRVSTMASERVEGIKLSLKKNSMELSSYHQDFGDANEEVEIHYEGPPMDIGFNAKYLMEALNVIDTDEVIMELKDEGNPGIIRPSLSKPPADQICIIMPMRI
jgi:DNA polymerase-3 subunit beta